jgi:hypothetical protein
MSLGPTELIILLVIGITFVVPIWAAIDAATKPDAAWQAAGQNKVLWVLLSLFLGLLGSLIYLAAIRPKVVAAQAGTPQPAAFAGPGQVLPPAAVPPGATGMRECPWCAEVIRANARICRYCNREVAVPRG